MIDRPVILENQIQDYAWGSRTAIQELMGARDRQETPWAELWMGAHPKAPSRVVIDNEKNELNTLINRYPKQMLGTGIAEKFNNTLPFLFKVLAAEQPLSIQVHPDKTLAKEGFERENKLKIPIDAPHRNYRDPWPKPEIICAIETFVALNGFRPADDIAGFFEAFCPEELSLQIQTLKDEPSASGIKKMFASLLQMAEETKQRVIKTTLEKAVKTDSMEGEWVQKIHEQYPDDIGILSPLFLTMIQLEPHSAMFLSPGRMHAYLKGVGIELMANSDNVLRGGLTGKHMDVEELMRAVSFESSPIEILRPVAKNDWESVYPTNGEEFILSRIQTNNQTKYRRTENHGLEILLCMNGSATITQGTEKTLLNIEKGSSVLIPANAGAYEISGEAFFFKASIPATDNSDI